MAAQAPLQTTAFQLVLERFKASLTAKEKREFGATTLQDLHVAIETIQLKQNSEKRLRAMSKLERFLEGMAEYDKVVSVFLNTTPILAYIWGPMKLLLQVASTFYEAFDALMDAYQRVGEHIPLLTQYEQYFRDHPQMFPLLTLIFDDILKFHWNAMRYFKKRMWQQLFQALWKNFKAEFDGILRNMREHMTLIESQATLTQFAEVLRTRELAETTFKDQTENETLRRREVVHQWFSAANCEADQETYAKVRHAYGDTGQWLFRKNRFRSWFDPMFCSTHLLWINGIPGAGKTILASLIVEEAKSLPNVHVAFFYCRFQDDERSTFLGVMRGILSQLLFYDDSLLTYLYEKASTSGQIPLGTESLAKELLETAVKSFPRLYVIIDGIDECERDERKQIVSFCEELRESLPQDDDSLRFLFISQDDNIARKDFARMSSVKITEADTKKDIFAYATVRGLEIKQRFDLSLDRQKYVEEMIVEKAEGMFLFARLMSSYLYELTSLADLDNELSPGRFPQGPLKLDEVYSRITERLSGGTALPRAKSLKLLRWLVCAKRPLKWREIQCAVSIDIETQSVDWEHKKFSVDSKELCGSLVDMHADGTVNLVHHTAKKYLVDKNFVDLGEGESAFALLCVSYLGFEGFDPENEDTVISDYIPSGYYGMIDYSYAYWSRHVDAWLRVHTSKDALLELAEAAEVFIDLHWAGSQTKTVIPKSFLERWKLLEANRNFDKVVLAGYLGHRQLIASTNHSSSDQVLKLYDTIIRIRTCLENTAATMSKKERFWAMYGPEIFKCPRVNCLRFYNGFGSKQQRDEHVTKHERSFFCSFPGCPMALLGCSTLKELQKHETEYHEIISMDDDAEYPKLPPEKVSFDCTQCDAKFTRNHNLKIHMRTHNAPNEKNFVCAQCGKSFARQGDRTRHETTAHSGAKSFVCGGTLQDDTSWGCGHDFKRGDMLNRHWTSVRGKACILPKKQEEESQLANSSALGQSSTVSTPQI